MTTNGSRSDVSAISAIELNELQISLRTLAWTRVVLGVGALAVLGLPLYACARRLVLIPKRLGNQRD